jgi:hypothetical protein
MDEVKRWWDSKESKDLREVGARYGKIRVFAIEGLEQLKVTRRTGNRLRRQKHGGHFDGLAKTARMTVKRQSTTADVCRAGYCVR